ncbi:hypothetical protein [Emticicia sp. C21]|uniref:hypothetical protein n=1 Tax=Emticicia sp. C21 TaxID=2302915 RepID=UPI000E353AB1|nr:hypothetical protein [Emticicia sp. C21]RFS14003.1 hypothetical protein D0T08_23755 [Emticicia sp. C21]
MPNTFNLKNYVFKNQDPQSIAARNAINRGTRPKNARTISDSTGYANIGFNPSGFQYISGSSVYRPSAYVQNYFPHSITVEIQSSKANISNISTGSAGSHSQLNSKTYRITVGAGSSVLSNFDMTLDSTEASASIYMVSPYYVAPNWSNDWVYPIK